MRRIAVAVALIAVLSACTGQQARVQRSGKPSASAGGTLSISIGRPGSLDPAHSYERWSKLVASLICDPLVQLDPTTGDPVPAIAESWVVGGGGTQITLKLRKGVRFHDGSDLTAADVVAQLSRVASQETASNVASLLRPVVGWSAIHGDEEAENEEDTTRLLGVRVAGTHAVQISLAVPRADFIRVLAHPLASPVSRIAVTKDPTAFESQPVCAGPYRVARPWLPDDPTIELERFKDYYARNEGFTRGGAGYADRIELRVDGKRADVLRSRTGNVDAGTPYLEYIALPVDAPDLRAREARIALSQAIDRAEIVRRVYADARTVAGGFIPPSLGQLHRPAACGASAPAEADVVAARRSLAAAGVSLTGRTLTLGYNPDFENRALVTAVATQWERAFGARVELAAMPWDRYVAKASATEGFGGPLRMGWEPPYLGPDAVLAPLFASSSIGSDNVSRFADPRFDRALERDARRAVIDEDLRDEYQRLEDIVCEQMPAIPITFGAVRYAVDRARVDSAVDRFADVTTGAPLVRELFVRS